MTIPHIIIKYIRIQIYKEINYTKDRNTWEVCNMNRTVDQMIKKSNDYQYNRKRIWIAGIAILFLLILFSICFITKTVTAERDTDRAKLVMSIEVEKGDTLWSIASNYITDEYDDMNEYIEEIKYSNGMISDDIHAGNYIIVPYYTDAAEVFASIQ